MPSQYCPSGCTGEKRRADRLDPGLAETRHAKGADDIWLECDILMASMRARYKRDMHFRDALEQEITRD